MHLQYEYSILVITQVRGEAEDVGDNYGTAHVQVYKKTCVILRDSENFEDNLRVRRVRHEEYIAREWLL